MEKKQLVYILLIWCLVIAMSSCKSGWKKNVVTEDGCDYIVLVDTNGVSSVSVVSMGHSGVCRNPIHTQNIDLPEEWEAISTDSLKPDTLLGYRSTDGVSHISFTGKSNK